MFENEYEFVKHYIDTSGVNECTAIDMACDIDINGFPYFKVVDAVNEYLDSLKVDESDREEFLVTLEEYYCK